MDHVGPLSRRVRDAAIVLGAIAGHDHGDPQSSRRPLADYLAACGDRPSEQALRGLRVGLLAGPFFECPLDPQIDAAVAEAVTMLGRLGATVAPIELRRVEDAAAAAPFITLAEASSTQDELLRAQPELYGDDMRRAFQLGELISARQYLRALRIRPLVQRDLGRAFERADVLVCPTTCLLPPRIAARTVTLGDGELDAEEGLRLLPRLTRPFSVAGVPAVAVPCGFSREGLPISLQIVGRPFDEATILRVGHVYEQATDWHRRPPPVA